MREKILEFIKNHRETHGFAPTQAAIARALGVTRQNICLHFKNLENDLKEIPEYRRHFIKNTVSPTT